MLRNFLTISGLIAVSSAYLWMSPWLMPGGASPLIVIVNLGAAPFIVGLLAGYLMIGRLVFKLAALLLIPIAHVFIYGQDPAKPGLQNLIALLEVLSLWIGCVVTHMLGIRKSSGARESGQPQDIAAER